MIRIEVDGSELRKGIERLVELGNKGERAYMPLCRIAGIVDITAMIITHKNSKAVSVAFAHSEDGEGNTFSGNIYEEAINAEDIIDHISGLLEYLEDIYSPPSARTMGAELAIKHLLPAILEKLEEQDKEENQ